MSTFALVFSATLRAPSSVDGNVGAWLGAETTSVHPLRTTSPPLTTAAIW